MSKVNREIIDEILTHKQIISILKDLHKSMSFCKEDKIHLKYDENVNPEIDYDCLEAVLEYIIDRALKLKDKKVRDVECGDNEG